MPDNGNYQLQTNATPAVRICEIVSESESLDRVKLASKLYGGGYLLQTVGTPSVVHTLKLRAWSRTEQSAVNAAEADCTIITAKLGETEILGAILEAPSWSIVSDAGIFEATVKFVEMTP